MKTSFFIIFLSVPFFLFSIDLSGWDFDGTINPKLVDDHIKGSISSFIFEDGSYEFWHSLDWIDDKDITIPRGLLSDYGYIEEGHYYISKDASLYKLNLESNSEYTFMKSFGVLFHSRRMFLYHGDELFFMSTEPYGHDSSLGPYVDKINSSSYLSEGITEYKGRNIIRPFFEKSKPWVEGVSGDGIGQWIELETSAMKYPVSKFLISNGYVSFEKPYLYEYNNRVKRLRVTCDQLGIDVEIALEDTPNFQEVELPVKIEEKNATFRFEILEVYEGLKWDDTCINLIIPLGDVP